MENIGNRIAGWVEKRLPGSESVILSHKGIFVLPTRWGCLFILLAVVILIAGVNYQNSMVLGVAFLLFTIAVLNIISAYRNLSGMKIKFRRGQSCYAGERAGFEFICSTTHSTRHDEIEIGWPPDYYATASVVGSESSQLKIDYPTKQRGLFRPGRLLVTSTYPMGLVRVWSWQDLQASAVIYPVPEYDFGMQPSAASDDENAAPSCSRSGDDFYGLKTYEKGESLSRVAWKHYAQKGKMYTKEFAESQGAPEWIDFSGYSGIDTERRLSIMCGLVLNMESSRKSYGLKMPGIEIAPNSGTVHKEHCLRTIATYPDYV